MYCFGMLLIQTPNPFVGPFDKLRANGLRVSIASCQQPLPVHANDAHHDALDLDVARVLVDG
jgi:hypothetical protein